MIEFDSQQISETFRESFVSAWETIGKPLVETLINLFIELLTLDPVGDIILVTTVIGSVMSVFFITFRWAIKQINDPYR